MVWPPDFTLKGQHVEVIPLEASHIKGLCQAAAGLDALWYTSVPNAKDMAEEIARRLSLRKEGSMQPFTLRDHNQIPQGMTTYMNIDAKSKRLEIGSTWISLAVQRTPFNTEAKMLLLEHAFEALDCIAVEFRTHFFNHQSRRAIERLGAKLDGVLRSHQVLNGVLRDTAVYSIIASEWPTVKRHLSYKLTQGR